MLFSEAIGFLCATVQPFKMHQIKTFLFSPPKNDFYWEWVFLLLVNEINIGGNWGSKQVRQPREGVLGNLGGASS